MTPDALGTALPLLRRFFAAITEQQLSWVLLRYPEDLAAPSGDIDLLVAPADTEALHHIAQGLGFVALPGWDEGPNLILVSYEHASDRWLVLDVVTTIAFRAPAERSQAAAEQVLDRRRFREGIAVPADEDAFWLLLAHCLLDKCGVPPRYRERLVELASAAAAPGAGTHAIGTPATALTTALTTVVLERRWEEVERLGRRLAGELERRSPSERIRDMPRRTRAIARRPLLLPRRMGVSVALVGPNGVGKSTVAAGLRRSFPFDARIVYMGLWSAADAGAGGTLGAAVARPLRIWRRHLLAQYHRYRGRLVVFDRYVYEAALPARPPLLRLKRPYFWFLRHAVPAPDVAVLLDVPGQVAYERKQENPPDELEAERLTYRRLVDSVPSFELVDASRDLAAVRADVMALVWSAHAGRWQRPTRSSGLRRAAHRSAHAHRSTLADACALVPRILDRESAAAGAVVADARLTDTGTALLTLAREGEPPWAVVKLPSTEEGADAMARESETLALLHADERLASLRSIVPRPFASGAVLDQPYRLDAHLGGHELGGRLLGGRLAESRRRREILETAAETIHTLHERTASTVVGDESLALRWVDARLDDLARAGAGIPARFRGRTARLRDELHDAVIGRPLVTSWVHGDYWPGNVLFSADCTSVHGIVDWDAADPVDLPMHDLLHLLLYTRRLVHDEQLGAFVRRELRAPGLSPMERGIFDRCGEWPPGGLPSYRLAVLLYWLRHVALHARQHAHSADWAYRVWQARNVNAVLGAL